MKWSDRVSTACALPEKPSTVCCAQDFSFAVFDLPKLSIAWLVGMFLDRMKSRGIFLFDQKFMWNIRVIYSQKYQPAPNSFPFSEEMIFQIKLSFRNFVCVPGRISLFAAKLAPVRLWDFEPFEVLLKSTVRESCTLLFLAWLAFWMVLLFQVVGGGGVHCCLLLVYAAEALLRVFKLQRVHWKSSSTDRWWHQGSRGWTSLLHCKSINFCRLKLFAYNQILWLCWFKDGRLLVHLFIDEFDEFCLSLLIIEINTFVSFLPKSSFSVAFQLIYPKKAFSANVWNTLFSFLQSSGRWERGRVEIRKWRSDNEWATV